MLFINSHSLQYLLQKGESMRHYNAITFDERKQIEKYISLSYTWAKIAKILDRDSKSILNEVKNNSINGLYKAIEADTISKERKKRKHLKPKSAHQFTQKEIKSAMQLRQNRVSTLQIQAKLGWTEHKYRLFRENYLSKPVMIRKSDLELRMIAVEEKIDNIISHIGELNA